MASHILDHVLGLSIKVLTPAKILSKTFQSEDVDSVETESLINRTKQNMRRIQKKEFEQLPTVKRFFKRVEEKDRKHTFHDVTITHFEQSTETAKNTKESWVTLISDAIES